MLGSPQPATTSQLALNRGVHFVVDQTAESACWGFGSILCPADAFCWGAFSCSAGDMRGDVSSGICGGAATTAPATSAGSRDPWLLRCVTGGLRVQFSGDLDSRGVRGGRKS